MTSQHEALEFDLTEASVPVKLKDKDGNIREWTLRETSGQGRDGYLNSLSKRTKYDKNGNPVGVGDFNGLQSNLIARCLFDENGKQVSESDIQKLPGRVVAGLFAKAKELNALDDDAEELAKND